MNRFLSCALLVCGLLAASTTFAQPPRRGPGGGEAMLDQQIAKLHDALNLTPAQDASWQGVAQTMRDNETNLRSLMMDRQSRMDGMNALDSLKTASELADAHAAAAKKMAESFGKLYMALNNDQKVAADEFFREQRRQMGISGRPPR